MSKNNKIDDFFKKRSQEEVNNSNPCVTSTDATETENPNIEKSNDHESNLATENPNYEEPPFKRDPGKRKPIWEYQTSKEQNEIRKHFLQKGPYTWHTAKYPSDQKGRKFCSSWFKLFPDWLEYSPTTNAAYCLPCFLYAKPSGRQRENAFTIEGFRSWNKVNEKDCAFLKHIGRDHNSAHKDAVKKCNDLLRMEQHIDTLIDNITPEIIERNRLKLKVSIVAVRWLTFQHCAFRGHDESVGSLNRGNYLEFIQAIVSFSEDVEKVVLENAPGNASYTSHQIQQEILSIYSGRIRDVIRNEIGDQKYCIIVDETKDVSKREQMTVVLRFVDKNGYIQERLFYLIHVEETNALYLNGAIEECLLAHKLNIENIRGQGYDGASAQRGEADKAYDDMTSFEFVLVLHIMIQILGITNDLCHALHRKSQDILNGMHLVSNTKILIQKLRDDGWENLLQQVLLFCNNHDIEVTNMEDHNIYGRGKFRQPKNRVTNLHYFRYDVFIAAIYSQLHELDFKFNDDMIELLSLSSSPDPKTDFTEQEKLNLKSQLDLFLLEIKEHPQLDSLKSISDLCRWLAETEKGEIYYPIDRLRAFSAMKLIKTALRNRMEDDYLTYSLIVYVEKGIAKEFDIDSIIDEFASKKDRRSLLKISKTNK
ncbi:hypothetical protein RND81_12G129600 [Saponaria officinalis]|uniref:TTF-type domain-containing protein n=1 Tax=Saponaria officinalis TaxID=3572 RepID=A0AAW1HA32_SAPOF